MPVHYAMKEHRKIWESGEGNHLKTKFFYLKRYLLDKYKYDLNRI